MKKIPKGRLVVYIVILIGALVWFLYYLYVRPQPAPEIIEHTGTSQVTTNSKKAENSNSNKIIVADGLVAAWQPSSSGGGSLLDVLDENEDATLKGDARVKTDGNDQVLYLNGSESYAEVKPESSLGSLAAGSISVWFKMDKLPGTDEILPVFSYGSSGLCTSPYSMANEGVIIEVGHDAIQANSKRLYFTIYADGCSEPSFCFDSGEDLEAGKWYNFVAIVDPGYNTGYLNGSEMTNRRYNFGDKNTSEFLNNAKKKDVLWFGRGPWTSGFNYFEGSLGETRIYDKPLSADEVMTLYKDGYQ